MPRRARQKSISGIYHVILRGVNHQQIFYEDADYAKYIYLLRKYKEICGYEIYAYCLMGNHIHLLIGEGKEKIDLIFKRLGAAFAFWYNTKYERSGHIFQDRFKSEPVDSQEYFLTVFRYILRNPVKAHMCISPIDYQYSNARDLMLGTSTFSDTTTIFEYISKNSLREFLLEENDDECLDLAKSYRYGISDEAATELILQEFGTLSPIIGSPDSIERQLFNDSVQFLKSSGVGVRQLSRLTGLSRKLLQ